MKFTQFQKVGILKSHIINFERYQNTPLWNGFTCSYLSISPELS